MGIIENLIAEKQRLAPARSRRPCPVTSCSSCSSCLKNLLSDSRRSANVPAAPSKCLQKLRSAHKSLLCESIHPISGIMAATIEDLKQLPVSEKIQLVEDLWDSIAAETSPIGLSPQHIAELDHRLDALEKNPRQGSPWSAVREKILAAL
jgi:putative addiction module component (TIGR02574 family)